MSIPRDDTPRTNDARKILGLKQLSETVHYSKMEQIELELNAEKGPELPKGFRWVHVAVPVQTLNGEDYLDGNALQTCDLVKAKAILQDYERVTQELEKLKSQ
jgi:hypothetical protein